MEKLKLLVIEDDFIIGADVAMQLTNAGYDVLGIISKGSDALSKLEDLKPDLILMDIHLKGEMDGIETAHQINKRFNIPIIYLTANADDATYQKARATKPYAFIAKPFSNVDLLRSIDLALEKMAELAGTNQMERTTSGEKSDCFILQDRIFVRDHEKHVKINIEDILYMEAERNYSKFYTADSSYLLSMPLKSLEGKIDSPQFKRVHRSYVVNINHLEEVLEDYVIIKKVKVPISRSFRPDLMASIKMI